MTRGKRAEQTAKRAQERGVAEVAAELGALTKEQERHAAAAARLAQVDTAAERLRALELARDRLTGAERQDLDDETKRLESVVRRLERLQSSAQRAWDRYSSSLIAGLPPGHDKLSMLMALLDERISVADSDHERKRGTRATQLVRQARGESSRHLDETTERILDLGHDPFLERPSTTRPDGWPGPMPARPVPVEWSTGRTPTGGWVVGGDLRAARQLRDEAVHTNPLSATRTSAFMWWTTLDWIAEQVGELPERPLRDDLGALASERDIEAWMVGGAGWPVGAPDAEECWVRDAGIAKAAGRFRDAWSPSPRFARPGDASLLRHLYVQRLTGLLVGRTEWEIPDDAQLNDETTWATPSLAPLTASMRASLARSIPFWMPPGETAAFAGSEPLDAESIVDIQLPFPAVLIVPAEPMRLEPSGTADDGARADLDRLDRCLLNRLDRGSGVDRALRDMDKPATRAWQVGLDQALRFRGGLVEAVLVRQDRSGGVADGFAWCLAIPHPDPRCGSLGRVVVPALLSRTAYADAVRQLAAAVAWADWHRPDPGDLSPGRPLTELPQFDDLERTGTIGGVHVLDAARTYASASSSDGAGDGPGVAPHLRRAHWRRARVGTRADWDQHRSYRRIRIAPVVVNAGKALPFSAQVYRLRSAEASPPSG